MPSALTPAGAQAQLSTRPRPPETPGERGFLIGRTSVQRRPRAAAKPKACGFA